MNYAILQDLIPFDFMGLQIRDCSMEPLTSASVALISVPPAVSHAKAKSTKSDKLYVCLSGHLSFITEQDRIEMEPSGLLVIPQGRWFEYKNQRHTTATILLIHIPPFDLQCEVFER